MAVVLLAASLGVVLTPNLFHAVLYLAPALVRPASSSCCSTPPFLFGVQLLLYAGGVVTIVVFAIMLTERLVGEPIRRPAAYLINGALLSARRLRRRDRRLPGADAARRGRGRPWPATSPRRSARA